MRLHKIVPLSSRKRFAGYPSCCVIEFLLLRRLATYLPNKDNNCNKCNGGSCTIIPCRPRKRTTLTNAFYCCNNCSPEFIACQRLLLETADYARVSNAQSDEHYYQNYQLIPFYSYRCAYLRAGKQEFGKPFKLTKSKGPFLRTSPCTCNKRRHRNNCRLSSQIDIFHRNI